jgi:hypothetical protein
MVACPTFDSVHKVELCMCMDMA